MPARQPLPPGGFVEHQPGFLSQAEASRAFGELVDDLRWEQRDIVLFGRRILQPRLIAWAGELGYRYSGQTLEPRRWSSCLTTIRQQVEHRTGARFNHVLVNRYRNGDDHMGMHADDEPELGDDPTVVIVSLGESRRFSIRARRGGKQAPRLELRLAHGDLLWMGGSCQHHWRHGVPKQRTARGERVSLTFRLLLRPPG